MCDVTLKNLVVYVTIYACDSESLDEIHYCPKLIMNDENAVLCKGQFGTFALLHHCKKLLDCNNS